jgi:hypothetical protein
MVLDDRQGRRWLRQEHGQSQDDRHGCEEGFPQRPHLRLSFTYRLRNYRRNIPTPPPAVPEALRS